MHAHVHAALLALLPSLALANGGPVAFGGPGPQGGFAPRKEPVVRLVSEELQLTIADDARTYAAEARYLLANPGPARQVTFGVPLDVVGDDDGEWEDAPRRRSGPAETAAEAARSIRIALAGRSVPCRPEVGRPAAAAPGKRAAPPPAWCVASLEIPSGEAIPLTLAFTGPLSFVDMSFTKSALVEFGARKLRYQLFPAGNWAGTPKRVSIRLAAGRFEGLVRGSPPPTGESGGALVWEWPAPDLGKIGALEVTVDAEPVLRHRELLTAATNPNLAGPAKLRARASSTLAPQGSIRYDASRAVDRDGATAWCAARGRGAGEWLEVEVEPAGEHSYRCHFEGVALVPGYAKSQAAWEANNRIRAFAVGACGHPPRALHLPDGDPRSGGEAASNARPALSKRHDRSAMLLPIRGSLEAELDGSDPLCVRLEVLEVEKGAAGDTCISELRPIYNCM